MTVSWWHRLLCFARRHPERTVLACPEPMVALTIRGCLCGKKHDASGRALQFPLPFERVRRIA